MIIKESNERRNLRSCDLRGNSIEDFLNVYILPGHQYSRLGSDRLRIGKDTAPHPPRLHQTTPPPTNHSTARKAQEGYRRLQTDRPGHHRELDRHHPPRTHRSPAPSADTGQRLPLPDAALPETAAEEPEPRAARQDHPAQPTLPEHRAA